jgi:hypothetical protein
MRFPGQAHCDIYLSQLLHHFPFLHLLRLPHSIPHAQLLHDYVVEECGVVDMGKRFRRLRPVYNRPNRMSARKQNPRGANIRVENNTKNEHVHSEELNQPVPSLADLIYKQFFRRYNLLNALIMG